MVIEINAFEFVRFGKSFAEKYTLNESLEVEQTNIEKIDKKYLRLELLERIQTLQEEIEDMGTIVKEEYLDKQSSDEQIQKLNNKVKELEQKIVELIENK